MHILPDENDAIIIEFHTTISSYACIFAKDDQIKTIYSFQNELLDLSKAQRIKYSKSNETTHNIVISVLDNMLTNMF